MRTIQTLAFVAMVLATSACAGNVTKQQAVTHVADIPPTPTTTAVSKPNTSSAPMLAMSPADDAGEIAAVEDPGGTKLDAEDNFAGELIRDPWEGFNRKMHSFNNTADKFVLRPLAIGYKKIMPEAVQTGLSRFLANLSTPVTAVNQALQGRPGDASRSLGRLAVNTTVGIIGVFDPASHFGMPSSDDEDFGQTLATWGWRDSRYLVLPLFGPRTVRDAVGMVGDHPLSPISKIQDSGVASGLQALEIVEMRTQLLPMDSLRRDAIDDYLFVRDAWGQHRNHQIQGDLQNDRD
ncbi:MAG: VacJ family lipoprotein [Propionivibrio sp.]